MPIEVLRASLVMETDWRDVRAQVEAAPVAARTVAPWPSAPGDCGPLPALVLPPPAEVHFQLGAMGVGSRLQFALGFDQGAHRGEESGRVRFRLKSADRTLSQRVLRFGPDLEADQKAWTRLSFDLAGVEELTIETELLEGTGYPPAAFASLEVIATESRPRERADEQAPNVVFIVVDTLRFDRLGCYGNERGLTPNIDALAERGVLFESAFASAPWTWPSTASILTGLTSAEHGVSSDEACYLAEELSTFAEVMQRAGWTTGGFTGNPLICRSKSFDQGFERFQEFPWKHAGVLMEEALAWLDELGEWRFLLYLQFIDPHDYRPSKGSSARWAREEPRNFTRAATRELLALKVHGEPYDEAAFETHVGHLSDLYDATVADVDREVGRLIDSLRERGQLERTLFVVTSDHGEEFLDHGTLYHGAQLHREVVGVPLILAGPGVPRGVRVAERAENRFLGSTLLGHLGLEAAGALGAVNLLDSAAARTASLEPSFASTTHGMWPRADGTYWSGLTLHGVRLGDELFMWVPEAPGGESVMALFDLAQDPRARREIAALRPQRCADLRALIERWLERGETVRPKVMGGGAAALELLQGLGYVER
jgi:arylsulfatase A-like enzyme